MSQQQQDALAQSLTSVDNQPKLTTIQPSQQLDTQGLHCPEPVMMLHRAIRHAQSGDVVEVLATDPSTSWDIPKFCMHLGHTLLLQEQQTENDAPKLYRYWIQKG